MRSLATTPGRHQSASASLRMSLLRNPFCPLLLSHHGLTPGRFCSFATALTLSARPVQARCIPICRAFWKTGTGWGTPGRQGQEGGLPEDRDRLGDPRRTGTGWGSPRGQVGRLPEDKDRDRPGDPGRTGTSRRTRTGGGDPRRPGTGQETLGRKGQAGGLLEGRHRPGDPGGKAQADAPARAPTHRVRSAFSTPHCGTRLRARAAIRAVGIHQRSQMSLPTQASSGAAT